MLMFGEFNTFRRADALEILTRSREALGADGCMIAEVHTRESIQTNGARATSWSAQEQGLFSDKAHIRINDAFWDEDSQTTIERHYIIDAETAEVSLFGTTTQSYTRDTVRGTVWGSRIFKNRVARRLAQPDP